MIRRDARELSDQSTPPMISRLDRPRMNRRNWLASLAALPCWVLVSARTGGIGERARAERDRGAIVRGPRDRKHLALVFTGDRYAESAELILDVLRRRRIRAACFLTGRFLREPDFRRIVRRARDEGHDLGPHGDGHLLYATWDRPHKLLVTRAQFHADLAANDRALAAIGSEPARFPYFLPPYEHYTAEIAGWTAAAGRILINLTPGTLSHTDYMEDADPRFVPADRIVESILRAERTDPDGLNGFLLLMHLGAGPRRTRDHLHDRLDHLLGRIADRGYAFVRVPDLLAPET
jgi:peptidoglycan/xylan/chitin deacetylase (PgdA/CDA1 family)